MEAKAFDFLQAKDWVRAAEAFNELLALKLLTKGQIINYLLHRSECFSELDQHEAAVADCRRIINIADPADDNGSKARNRLIKSLVLLRRFSEAELATQEWVSVQSGPNHKVATKFLEHLHKALQSNGRSKSVEAEILARLHAFDPKMERNDEQVFVCTYCSVLFRDKMELRGHCQTEGHQRVIMSDEGRDWQWRPPPRGFTVEAYTLCDGWAETGNCRYGLQCVEAHGTEELKEWRERFEYRRMKLQRAYESELYGKSYTEELIEKLVQSTSPDMVMREKLPDIEDTTSNKLAVSISWKNSRQDWMFTLSSHSGGLRAVALLQDTHRNYFKIEWIQFAANGHWHDVKIPHDGQEWIYKPEAGIPLDTRKFRVSVFFGADIYGTFRQSVIFDFGTEPVLVKHLCVDVIPLTDVEKINEIRKEVVLSSSERWNHMNSEIVQFSSPLTSLLPSYGNTESDWAKRLTSTYPCPHAESFDLSQATIVEKRLTRNNYKARMHELLYVEEMARYERVARYNVNTKLRITHSYLLCPNSTASSTAKYSSCGELFALMHLGKDLSEDTSAGRLILNNCTTIFLALDDPNAPRHKVYEALVEDKGKTMIYLRLSTQTVTELSLIPDQEVKFNVQFQLNRIPYCEWHYAIDKIPDFKVVFPDTYLEPNIPWTPARQWSDSLDGRLNLKQKEAIVAITTPLYVCLPPVLIIGPFGTGKTFTLAQAIKQLIAQPENRILICTQSNSAADLYIKDYLHPYVEAGHEEARPLRIYYHKRWVATVNQVVQKYCLIESGPGGRSFRVPSVEDIVKHRIVVVTLSISMYLSTMDLPRGFFTHIFLDEAAQAMECEAIMPLALANQNTRIVLAGDHMQLSPELFSQFAKDRGLHVSLLERLYDHYPAGFPCKILLSENYRAHEAIINFTSESFYDQKLISSGKQPRHEIYYPLTFFTTRGEDVQDLNSTAFYNNSEVYEIVERVLELKKHWPNIWGKFDDHSIGIMTPYSDQVLRIRSELRKRQLFGISVERVLNVQGKQFRAIFLSTVRTRRTCKSGDDVDFGFLSNSKLLNTAITRAQSLVAVVGDPIALCSIGKCSKVWERFLQICEDNKSLFGITWLSIRNQLDGVELKKTYVLNPLAPEFIPRKYKEQYIRAQLIPEINIPPMPPPNKNPGLPFKIPIYPIIPTNFIPMRPVPPMPPWLPLHPRPFPKEHVRHMIPPLPAPNKPEEKNLIQFFNNVHFPESKQQQQQHQQQQQQPPPPQSQPHLPQLPPQNPLKEYITLLPPNMSLADMILQPYNQQASWFYYLLEHKGIEAAKKFEYLIHTTTKKENVKLIPQVAGHCIKPVIPVESSPVPLYKRQSEKEPPPRQPELTQLQLNERQLRQQQWQQQINDDFANLSLQNGSGDGADDIFKRYNVSYASVVRTQKPFEEPSRGLVNGVNCESLNGPRLYQYF